MSNKIKRSSESYEWIGAPTSHTSDGRAHYRGVKISRAEGTFNVGLGHVVLLKSPDATKPYIAMIDELYKNKSGSMLCKSTWFYR